MIVAIFLILQKLSILKENFPGVPILAMTATATQKAKLDIIQTLRMSNCEVFSQSFNRTNLWYALQLFFLLTNRYEVRKKTKTALNDIIAEINTKHRGKCGIIYCLSQADCEKVAQKLQEKGLSAAYYHAGEGNEERSEKQSEWCVSFLVSIRSFVGQKGRQKSWLQPLLSEWELIRLVSFLHQGLSCSHARCPLCDPLLHAQIA